MQIVNCTEKCKPLLREFIDRHWKKDHVLATEPRVLDWYYGTNEGGCNFLLARNGSDILGVLGFIDPSRFGDTSSKKTELWLALWKVREVAGVPGVGLRLLTNLKKRFPNRSIAVIGLSNEAQKIFGLLRYQFGSLEQLFIYNQSIEERFLLSGSLPDYVCRDFNGSVSLITEEMEITGQATDVLDCRHRHANYFINRYLNNPFVHYSIFHVELDGQVSFVVTKLEKIGSNKALRVVDVFGSPRMVGLALGWFSHYLVRNQIEYMDFYLHSTDTDFLIDCGFIKRSNCDDSVVVPNYFSPFVSKNVDLDYAYEPGFEGPIFKADGDQERPVRIER